MDGIITNIQDKSVWVDIPDLGTNLRVFANGHKDLAVNSRLPSESVGHVQAVAAPGQIYSAAR